MHNNLKLQCDIALKASLKDSDAMEFRKRFWLLYLWVTGLEIALTMFVTYVQHQSAKNASNWSRTAECFRTFILTSG